MGKWRTFLLVFILLSISAPSGILSVTSIGLYDFSTRTNNSCTVTNDDPYVMLFVMICGHDVWFAKYKLAYPEGLVLSETMFTYPIFPYSTEITSYSYDDAHGWTVEYGECPSGWFVGGVISIECNPDMSGVIEFERFEYEYDGRIMTGPIYIACG